MKKSPFIQPVKTNTVTESFVTGDKKKIDFINIWEFYKAIPTLLIFGIYHFDLLKIDVEGFETYALKGLRKEITRNRPIILMEYSEKTKGESGSESSLKDFLPVDYDEFKFRAEPKGYKLLPLDIEKDVGEAVNIVLIPHEKLNCLPENSYIGK